MRFMAGGLQIELGPKEIPAAKAQTDPAGVMVGLHGGKADLQGGQAALLLVQLVGAGSSQAKFGDDFAGAFDAALGFGYEFRATGLDGVDLAFQSHTYRVELARGDAKQGQEVAFEVVELAAGLQGCKQSALGAPVQVGVGVQRCCLPGIEHRARVW